jgi:hypothetical protein
MPRLSIRQTLANVEHIPSGRCYLVIGPNTWGKAFTAKQAWENASKPNRFLVYDAPPDCFIDEMGASCWYPQLYTEKPECSHVSLNYKAKQIAQHGEK